MANKQGKNKIDYLDFTISPIKGKCPNITNHAQCESYCYMAQFFHRFKHGKRPMDPTIRLDKKELNWNPSKPSKIGVCFNLDMFHPDIDHDEWIYQQIEHTWEHPEHEWYYLTKFPERYADFDFPKEAWLGATIDGLPHTASNAKELYEATTPVQNIWLSYEPLLSNNAPLPTIYTEMPFRWIVIGQDTSPGAKPIPQAWVDRIVLNAVKNGIAVWMKDSLSFISYIMKERSILPNATLLELAQQILDY